MCEGNPPTPAYLLEPLFIGGIVAEVIRVAFHRQAAGAQNFRKFLAEVAVGEKDRTRVHAARS